MSGFNIPKRVIVVDYAGGKIAFSPLSRQVAFAKSEDTIVAFVEKENTGLVKKVCSWHTDGERRVSLILTKNCPLRCIYCYAWGGESKLTISKSLALRSIREVAKNSPETLHVTFFGGEPTLCMGTVWACVELAKTLAPKCLFHLSTGGVVPECEIDYLVEQGFTINLSMDGPPDIQNRLRPLPDDQPSAEFVEGTIKHLVALGAAFKVRCTVTELNVRRLTECVKYWIALGVPYVHFEPINIAGRAARDDMNLPDADVYIENYLAALDVAERYGIGLINSAYMNLLNPSPCYCTTVAGDKLVVAPDGAVTLCYEVQECNHPLNDFVIGRYDPDSDEFVINREKEKPLHSITVDSYEECKDCFAKFVCSGGCPNRNVLATGSLNKVHPWLCKVKKALIRNAIIRIYKASKEGKTVSPVAGDLSRSGISPIT